MLYHFRIENAEDLRQLEADYQNFQQTALYSDFFKSEVYRIHPDAALSHYLYNDINKITASSAATKGAYQQLAKDLNRDPLYRQTQNADGSESLERLMDFEGLGVNEKAVESFLSDCHPKASGIHQGVGIFHSLFANIHFQYKDKSGSVFLLSPQINYPERAFIKDETAKSFRCDDYFVSFFASGINKDGDMVLLARTIENQLIEIPDDWQSAIAKGTREDSRTFSFIVDGQLCRLSPLMEGRNVVSVSQDGKVCQDYQLRTPLKYKGPAYHALEISAGRIIPQSEGLLSKSYHVIYSSFERFSRWMETVFSKKREAFTTLKNSSSSKSRGDTTSAINSDDEILFSDDLLSKSRSYTLSHHRRSSSNISNEGKSPLQRKTRPMK